MSDTHVADDYDDDYFENMGAFINGADNINKDDNENLDKDDEDLKQKPQPYKSRFSEKSAEKSAEDALSSIFSDENIKAWLNETPETETHKPKSDNTLTGLPGDPQNWDNIKEGVVFSSFGLYIMAVAVHNTLSNLKNLGIDISNPARLMHQVLHILADNSESEKIQNWALIPIYSQNDFKEKCREIQNRLPDIENLPKKFDDDE